jgi:Ni,Fe-hydrogenase I large subunit
MSRRIIGPFNRVEGDLEIQLDIEGNTVASARVVSPLYRGFEQMLHGKDPRDALVYAPRICGICSVAQSVAAATALADAQHIDMPLNGQLATNLVLATENVADHLTHFYLFFMPDFARDVYKNEPWYDYASTRYRAVQGDAIREVLPARAAFMHLMGLLAGKWPHSLAIQPGGTTRALEAQEIVRLLNTLYGFRQFLERTVFGDTLENMLAINSHNQLRQWAEGDAPQSSDLRFFLYLCEELKLDQLGCTRNRFMSYGAYPVDGEKLFAQGVWFDEPLPLDAKAISEDVSHSWLAQQHEAKHPYDGVTIPDADAVNGYTWCKAPRLAGEVVEVGALARQLVSGQSMVRDLVADTGANVRNRVIARLFEMARVVVEMEAWAKAMVPKQPFCETVPVPEEAEGMGLIEAARGSLGHWLRIRKGRILNYQIIAPTTWNFSPRDQMGTPGSLEQALAGAPLREGESEPVAVQHIVRSFDPCMVCTVH